MIFEIGEISPTILHWPDTSNHDPNSIFFMESIELLLELRESVVLGRVVFQADNLPFLTFRRGIGRVLPFYRAAATPLRLYLGLFYLCLENIVRRIAIFRW